MKKIILALASIAFIITSCKKDDENKLSLKDDKNHRISEIVYEDLVIDISYDGFKATKFDYYEIGPNGERILLEDLKVDITYEGNQAKLTFGDIANDDDDFEFFIESLSTIENGRLVQIVENEFSNGVNDERLTYDIEYGNNDEITLITESFLAPTDGYTEVITYQFDYENGKVQQCSITELIENKLTEEKTLTYKHSANTIERFDTITFSEENGAEKQADGKFVFLYNGGNLVEIQEFDDFSTQTSRSDHFEYNNDNQMQSSYTDFNGFSANETEYVNENEKGNLEWFVMPDVDWLPISDPSFYKNETTQTKHERIKAITKKLLRTRVTR